LYRPFGSSRLGMVTAVTTTGAQSILISIGKSAIRRCHGAIPIAERTVEQVARINF